MRSGKHSSEEFSNLPFRDLKKLLQKKKKESSRTLHRSVAAGDSGRGIKDVPGSDEKLFHDAMKEVKEIRKFRDIPLYQKKTSSACKYRNTSSDEKALQALEEIVKGGRPVDLSETQEYVEWVNSDYGEDIIKKLREGRYSVQDCLDLHGIVLEDAKEEVESFFSESVRRGYRCVKIIHGRGLRSPKGPVLKHALIRWLIYRYRKKIIAFVTARQCDGGLGALYVLLR